MAKPAVLVSPRFLAALKNWSDADVARVEEALRIIPDCFGAHRQSEAAMALFLRLRPVPKRRRALLAAADPNVTGKVGMHWFSSSRGGCACIETEYG